MRILAFIFGLAIFLYAMYGLEKGIRLSAGEGFKHWIINRTNSATSSAAYGVVVTAFMQSSSMVSLLVLALVSAQIMPLFNGIGVVLGANLGTTVTGWVVTIVGFKMDLQALVVPLLGLGAAMSLLARKSRKLRGTGQALVAFGLLIFGLDVMKDSMTGLSEMIDIQKLGELPTWVYMLIGVVLAAVMQSSSAVMIIALSMLNSEIVQLTDAAAVVIGADLGTTSTTVLGSLGQSVFKKQLAFAHVFFNALVNLMAFFFLLPMLPTILGYFSIADAMFGLVTFHSMFNLLGLLIFLPLLRYYTRWIQRILPQDAGKPIDYFVVPIEVPEAAVDSLSSAWKQLCSDALKLNLRALNISENTLTSAAILNPASSTGSFEDRYEGLKKFESDLIRYAGRLQQSPLSAQQSQLVSEAADSARTLVYASKTLKDVRHDLEQLETAFNAKLGRELEQAHTGFFLEFLDDLIPLLFLAEEPEYVAEKVYRMKQANEKHQRLANEIVSGYATKDSKAITQFSTWFNLNLELHHYARNLLNAIEREGRHLNSAN
ncbi:MAG: Na/Pi symporter [Pseudomonadota bacterium]